MEPQAMLSAEALHDLFLARCKDLGDQPSQSDMRAFAERCQAKSVNGVVDLRACFLGRSAALALTGILRDSSAHTLDLYGNQLRDVGTSVVMQVLKSCKNIRKLNLGCNDMTADGAISVASTIGAGVQLEFLNLGAEEEHWTDNHVGPNGVRALCRVLEANGTLRHLGLAGNTISGNEEACAALANLVSVNAVISTLDLAGVQLGHAGFVQLCASLRRNFTLTYLNVARNGVRADGMAALSAVFDAGNCPLEHLDLSGNDIGGNGATQLADSLHHSSTLRTLSLAQNSIGDLGLLELASSIAKSRSITWLSLQDNRLSEKSAAALSDMLTSRCPLTALNVAANPIMSATVVALADSLRTNSVLQALVCDACRVGNDGAIALCKALRVGVCRLRSLSLRDNFMSDESALELLSLLEACPGLFRVEVHGNRISHSRVVAIQTKARENRQQAASVESDKLRMEIVRLRDQQHKLHETESVLLQRTNERAKVEAHVHELQDAIEVARREGDLTHQRLSKQLTDEKLQLSDVQSRLTVFEQDQAEQRAEFERRVATMETDIASEMRMRDNLQRELEDKLTKITDIQMHGKSRIKELQDRLANVREEKELLRQRGAALRAERAQVEANIELMRAELEQRRASAERSGAPGMRGRPGSTAASGARRTGPPAAGSSAPPVRGRTPSRAR